MEHKVPITKEDLKRLYSDQHAFSTSTPVGLQNKVLFEIMLYVCRRGRENVRQMTKQSFTVNVDSSGKKYVAQDKDELDKNHRADTVPDDTIGEGRMYETGGPLCPVRSFEKYLSKLSDLHDLWQRPLDSFIENEQWYCRVAIGKNTLSKFMVNLSTSARLSRANTNHCIRATCVTTLDEAGVEARHIMRITGHKNEASIRSYSCRLSDEKKRAISSTISDTLIPSTSAEEPPQKKTPEIDEVFDAETDAILREITLPSTSATSGASVSQNGRQMYSMQFSNCQVTININK